MFPFLSKFFPKLEKEQYMNRIIQSYEITVFLLEGVAKVKEIINELPAYENFGLTKREELIDDAFQVDKKIGKIKKILDEDKFFNNLLNEWKVSNDFLKHHYNEDVENKREYIHYLKIHKNKMDDAFLKEAHEIKSEKPEMIKSLLETQQIFNSIDRRINHFLNNYNELGKSGFVKSIKSIQEIMDFKKEELKNRFREHARYAARNNKIKL